MWNKALIAGLSLVITATAMASPTIGKPAPDFVGIDSNGRTHKLSEFIGKTLVLEWTNNGCPYVHKHYESGNMQSVQLTAQAKGAVWLSVISSAPGKQGNVTGAEANALTASRKAHPTAVILDPAGTIGTTYEARTTPHMFVIDGTGVLRYMGAIDDQPTASPESIKGARNYVLAAIDDLNAHRPVATSETESYGCSVKY